MSLLAALKARAELKAIMDAPDQPATFNPMKPQRIEAFGSPDLTRVLNLPRRPAPTPAELDALVAKWNQRLGRKNNKCQCVAHWGYCISSLKPLQAWALEEASVAGGLLAALPVGSGKAGIGLLAASAIPGVKTAILFVPPNLKHQMVRRDYDQWWAHFKVPNLHGGNFLVPGLPTLHIISYSELSNAKATDLLRQIRPDLIVLDEAHSISRRDASRTKRILRYWGAGENPDCKVVAMSGTLTSKSLKDYSHIAAQALKQNSPLPLHWPTVEEWAAVLDSSPNPRPPGALQIFGANVREGFNRRLQSTLGYVWSAEQSAPNALYLDERKPKCPPEVLAALKDVRDSWTRPDGEELVEAIEVARVLRQIAAGFYFRWVFPHKEPVPVIERWFEVRKAFNKELRDRLKTGREHMDSPLLLRQAAHRWFEGYTHEGQKYPPGCRTGPLPTWPSQHYQTWLEVKDTVRPETRAVWISDYLVKDAAKWAHETKRGGILWFENPELGYAVAKAANLPYFGGGEEASQTILSEKGDRCIVASIAAHGTGKNLQHAFSKNLVMQTPSSGKTIEQLLGRTHRQGQPEDEVWATFYTHTPEMYGALEGAKQDAQYVRTTMGTEQKILVGTWVR